MAILTVANGLAFVPGFVSFPFVETQISAAVAEKTEQMIKKRISTLLRVSKRILYFYF
ncbi:hypothetical protein D3C87_1300060 [compost metagenome]